ncbi:hypothetical protein SARC_09710 [Sphaeroforma arctica JP610]|uniref:Uncharacterized protein n=1 Tax=Sphaeroforma arctica JP610 TaxID=667725 RepID=A0A0L0FM55_9EUKA|nr:hypothetical protein SARC_09710 [Sphaeroforma arctica JP610]KNC77840.1 hypothetical protein SARC_09710 [Sphaeroforma arctica JP610]|eukprot:XP_014151742.1 hypothetical protein SARC_09710 [Sphaeroforma arctica JP610]
MPTCALAVSVSSCLVDMDSLHTFIGCLVQHYNNGTVDAKSLDRCQPLTDLSTRSQSAKSFDITNPPKGYYVEPKGFVSHIITRYRTSALESAVFRIAITHSVRARQMARKHITAALASCVWNILTDLKEAMRLSSHKSSSERIAHPPLATRQSSSFAIKHEKMRLYLPINLRHTQCISPDFFGNAEIQTMVELPTDSLLSASQPQCSMEDVADAIELHAITQQQRSAVQDVLDWLQGAERRDKGIMLDYRGSTGASFLTVQVSDKDWYNGLEFGSSGIPVFASIPSGKTGWHAQTIRANEEEFDLFVTLPRPAMEVMVQEWSQALLSEAEKQSS